MNEKPILAEVISETCRECGGICCHEYYSILAATELARTKKELIINPFYRVTLAQRMRQASGNSEADKEELAEALSDVDYDRSPADVLSKLLVLDEFYARGAPAGPCRFFHRGCIIQETKEYKCDGYYCKARSYGGAARDLQGVVQRLDLAGEVFYQHVRKTSWDKLLKLISLEFELFLTLPRLTAYKYIEPKVIVVSELSVDEAREEIARIAAAKHLEIIGQDDEMESFLNTLSTYFSPEYFRKNYMFLFSGDSLEMKAIKQIHLNPCFPKIFIINQFPGELEIEPSDLFYVCHYFPARFGLYQA